VEKTAGTTLRELDEYFMCLQQLMMTIAVAL
jgi:hypothetical protein